MKLPPLVLLFLGMLPVWSIAQQGDRPSEAQPPPNPNWEIPPAPVLSPAEAVTTFKLPTGLRAELVASEPLIHDPVTMAFAPDGRIWVAEMTGYMRDVDGTGTLDPTGNIVVLADTDGDGRMDQRTVFMEKLRLPRAIALIDGGVLMAEPPHLFFARDTDGDGDADTREVVADDYGKEVDNVEHLPNGLMWALDNWIYNAKSSVRYRYQGGGKFAREDTIPRGQWGITQDDVGRIYHNSNSDPLRVDLVPAEYLSRNPAFAAKGAGVQMVPGNLRVWPGRITTGINRGYRTLDEQGRMYAVTAACGPVIYRGSLLPAELRGDAFVAEPSGYLIKRIKLTAKGAVLSGANAYEGSEFMTSTDERFRPVNLFNGPDGALWIVDMYRGFIQDRRFLTTYLRRQVLERGLEKPTGYGRIWRIVPDTKVAPFAPSSLAGAQPLDLVNALSDPNGWTRDTAQQLLVEKRVAEPAVVAALRELALRGKEPLGRLHALWTLDGCGTIDADTLLAAMDDADLRVASAAVRLIDRFPPSSLDGGNLARKAIALAATRTEPALRLQLALTLSGIPTPPAEEAVRRIVIAGRGEPYLADAVVSGLAGRELTFLQVLAEEPAGAQCTEVLQFLTSAVLRHGNPQAIEKVLAMIAAESTPMGVRAALLGGVRHFVPKGSDGKLAVGKLPAAPAPLVELAAKQGTPLAAEAAELLGRLQWPGKAGAPAKARPLTRAETALFEKGKQQYAALCAACHQPTGQGLPGLAPPLVNSRWVLGDPSILARIVLDGKTKENLIMPPWKTLLDDEAIAGVLTFIRRSWDHQADPVTVAKVAEMRKLSAGRDEPWTDEQLEELAAGRRKD